MSFPRSKIRDFLDPVEAVVGGNGCKYFSAVFVTITTESDLRRSSRQIVQVLCLAYSQLTRVTVGQTDGKVISRAQRTAM